MPKRSKSRGRKSKNRNKQPKPPARPNPWALGCAAGACCLYVDPLNISHAVPPVALGLGNLLGSLALGYHTGSKVRNQVQKNAATSMFVGAASVLGALTTKDPLKETAEVTARVTEYVADEVFWSVHRIVENIPYFRAKFGAQRKEVTESDVQNVCDCYDPTWWRNWNKMLKDGQGTSPDPRMCAVLKHSTTKKNFAEVRPIKCPEEFKPQIREELERWAPYKTSRIEFWNVFAQWFSALVGKEPGLIESGLSRLAYVSRTAVKEDYTNIAPLMLFYYGTYTGFIFRPKRDMPEGFARKCAQAYLNGYALPFSVAVLEGVLAWSPTLFLKLALAGYFTWKMAGKHAKAQVLLEKHAGIRTEPSYAWDLLILMASILSAEELGNHTFVAGCFEFSKKISVTDARHPAQVFTSFGTAYYSGNSGYEIIVRKIMRFALLHWSAYQRLVEKYQKQLPE